MSITTKQYMKKPLYVEAVRITRRNFSEVAKWCGGHIQTERADAPQNAGKKYIKIDAHNPINARQTKAFVGDWVLQTERGFKIYTHTSFTSSFDEVLELVHTESTYPYEDGGCIIIGPQCFSAKDESVLNWKGVNYVPQEQDSITLMGGERVEVSFEEDLDSCAVPMGSRPVPSEQELLEEQRGAGLVRGE